jgi:MoaA/NifB/PqqE/SkfB family radical SAM enzyme
MRDDFEGEDLDPSLLERFLNDVKIYTRHARYGLTGGEPSIHHDLDGLFNAFRKASLSNYIVTNGQSDEGVHFVIRNRDVVDRVSISLDAPHAWLNDETRGKGTFDKVMKAIDMYRSGGVLMELRFVLHDRNAATVYEAFELTRQLRISRLFFSTLHPVGKAKKNGMTVTFEKMDEARREFNELKGRYPGIAARMTTRHIIPYTEPAWKEHCIPISGGLNGITLLPDGKISFCCDICDLDFIDSRYDGDNQRIDPIVGDFSKESLEAILKRKKMRIDELRKRRAKDAADGKLAGNRQYICENCKFYHYYS